MRTAKVAVGVADKPVMNAFLVISLYLGIVFALGFVAASMTPREGTEPDDLS